MRLSIRKWRIDDKSDIAINLNNPMVMNNLRDGLPYPYTEDEGIYTCNAIGGRGQYVFICDNT